MIIYYMPCKLQHIKTLQPTIKGQDFYDLASGVPGALSMLFDVLPEAISKIAGVNQFTQAEKERFRTLFDRAY